MLRREEEEAPFCRGGILADDMGLGKTFQMIGLIKNSAESLKTLIVCPPPLLSSWTAELRACGFEVITYIGAAESSRPSTENSIYLTSYNNLSTNAKKLATDGFQRIILDEGHVIRNGAATARWRSCMHVAADSVCRWILSATPVQNSIADWKNTCAFLRVDAKYYGRCAETIMLRRTMEELRETIQSLPPSPRFIPHDLHIVEPREVQLFQALCNQLQKAIDSSHVSGLIVLELYLRIQQFLVHPQIYIDAMRAKFRGGYRRPDWAGATSKWTEFEKCLRSAVADKVPTIVFCNFRDEMDRAAASASAVGAAVWSVRGGMGSEAIGESVAEARAAAEEGRPVVIIVQIVAGGVGLNLQFCRRVLFLSQHWNPAVVHQAIGRAVRIGQKAVVDVHLFRVVDDVLMNLDRRMVELHLSKVNSARSVCDSLYEGFEVIPDGFDLDILPPEENPVLVEE
jgi:hypothetical protein